MTVAPFRDQVASIPDQLRERACPDGRFPESGRLILSGMGGSGLAAALAATRFDGTREILLSPGDRLPDPVRAGDAVLCVSYSGRTAETLDVWTEAGSRGLIRGAVASGGPLLEEAERETAPRCRVAPGRAPRAALGSLVRAVEALLGPAGDDGGAAANHLVEIRDSWSSGETLPPSGREALEALEAGPVAVLGWGRGPILAARRWIADLAENAKQPAWLWPFPEAAHNQVMVFSSDAPPGVRPALLALGDPGGEPAHARWETTLAALEDRGARVVRLRIPHPDPWIETLGLAYAGDWISLLHAERRGVDPGAITLLDELKRLWPAPRKEGPP